MSTLREQYEKETKEKALTKCFDGRYEDEYVEWLEKKCTKWMDDIRLSTGESEDVPRETTDEIESTGRKWRTKPSEVFLAHAGKDVAYNPITHEYGVFEYLTEPIEK